MVSGEISQSVEPLIIQLYTTPPRSLCSDQFKFLYSGNISHIAAGLLQMTWQIDDLENKTIAINKWSKYGHMLEFN